MIEFQSVSKTYRVIHSRTGFVATLSSLFIPKYTFVRALKGVSFRIEQGELVGLIGENGAGKSTLVKIATGILRPNSGNALFGGVKVHEHRKRCALQFGVAFGQRRSLWWQLSAREGLEALARIYKVPGVQVRKRVDQLIDTFELGEFVDRQVRLLSLGQRTRCEVAGCFVHHPKIVFLDEPTIGMDVLAKIKMREYIKRINQEDRTGILLTSHDLFDVERVCERVMILDSGSLILDATFESMRRKFCSQRVLRLNLASPFIHGQLDDLEDIHLMPVDDRWRLKILFDPVRRPIMEFMTELQRRLDIVDFMVEDLPIDEFVAQIYKARSEGDHQG